MPGAEGPKYLNSPAGPLFDKSHILYGLDLAKATIRREKLTVIVEGYTDVMAAHQAGFTNVVASLGTALTKGQVEQALKYADEVALAYDVDLAGETATQRGLLEELVPVADKFRVIRIPAEKDPDEFVRNDPEGWRRAVAERTELMEYWIQQVTTTVDIQSVGGRREVTSVILPIIKRFNSPVEQSLYLQRLGRLVNVDEKVLREALAREPVRRAARAAPVPVGSGIAPANPLGPDPLEREALGLLLRYPALIAELTPEEPLPFHDAAATALIVAWKARVSEGPATAADLETFVGGLDPATAGLARELLGYLAANGNSTPLEPGEARNELRTCLLRLQKGRVAEDMHDAQLLLVEAQREGDQEQVQALNHTLNQLREKRNDVDKAMDNPALAVGVRRN